MAHGLQCARSVHHDLEPNIFPFGPPPLSISTYVEGGIHSDLTMNCDSGSKHQLLIPFKVLLRSKKTLLFFSSDFETLFTKHSPCEILDLNFEKKTVY